MSFWHSLSSLIRKSTASWGGPARRQRGGSRQCRLSVEVLEERELLSIYLVDRLTDTGAGNGLAGDLRYCLTQATSGDDTIQFDVTGIINLTGALPDLSASVTVEGPGADVLTVRRDTGRSYRIFTVGSGASVSISGLTINNGSTTFPRHL
jgi:hypothetical protein